MTRILLLIKNLADGGAQRVVTLWAQFLHDAGYQVTVLTLYPRAHEYPLCPQVTRANLFPDQPTWESCSDPINQGCHLLEQYLAQNPQDILIPFLYQPNLIAAACQNDHCLVVQTLRNSPWSQEQGFDRQRRDAAIIKQGVVLLQNDEQLPYFATPVFQNVKKYIIPNPLHPEIAHLQKTTYQKIQRILAIGRLVPQKNQRLMLETLQVLHQRYHLPCTLDIYGVGPEQDRLQQYCAQLGLQDYVRFCGRAEQIFPIAVNYDLYLLTSRHEGMPNALLECMGLGLPVLATKCPTGPQSLINDGQNGFLLADDTPETCAAKIVQINDVALLTTVGQQARRDMQRYAPEKCLTALTNCLQDLLSARR